MTRLWGRSLKIQKMGVVAVATRTFALRHDEDRKVTICHQLDRNARVRHPMSMLQYISSLSLLTVEEPPKKKGTPRKRTKRDSAPVEEPTTTGREEKADDEPREMKYWLMKAEPESRIVKGKVCHYTIER